MGITAFRAGLAIITVWAAGTLAASAVEPDASGPVRASPPSRHIRHGLNPAPRDPGPPAVADGVPASSTAGPNPPCCKR